MKTFTEIRYTCDSHDASPHNEFLSKPVYFIMAGTLELTDSVRPSPISAISIHVRFFRWMVRSGELTTENYYVIFEKMTIGVLW